MKLFSWWKNEILRRKARKKRKNHTVGIVEIKNVCINIKIHLNFERED